MTEGFHTCYQCGWSYGTNTADIVGSLVYGVSDAQSGKLMHQYKLAPHRPNLVQRVASLVTVGVKDHFDCVGVLLDQKPIRWTTVPSLKRIGSEHPFRQQILTPMLGHEYEIEVAASEAAQGRSEQERRDFNPELYTVKSEIPASACVLLIDDTWTTGGHIQSVATALKRKGAAKVAALSVARWLDMSAPRTRHIYDQLIKPQRYNPDICPWTGGLCPTTRNPFSLP